MDTIKTSIQTSYNNAKDYRSDMHVTQWKRNEVEKVLEKLDKKRLYVRLRSWFRCYG